MDTSAILNNLVEKKNMTAEEIELFLSNLVKGNINSVQGGAILTALRMKGETVDETIALIKEIRKNVIPVQVNNAIDVCGTGGDGIGSFNISTAVAFVLAGAGIKVVKHGGRAISSQSGSADVMENLGVNLKLSSQQAEKIFNKIGMVFLLAPIFHPAMKHIAAIRKELKIRTIFNFLGPFANPASVKRQIIGVPNLEVAEKLAKVGKKLSYKHLLIVTSEDGMDEVSTYSKTTILEIKNNLIKKSIIDPKNYGFKKIDKKEILGGTTTENAQIIKDILNRLKNPKRDIVVFNSAFALYVAGIITDIKEGMKLAANSIDSGRAKLVLENLIKETQKYA